LNRERQERAQSDKLAKTSHELRARTDDGYLAAHDPGDVTVVVLESPPGVDAREGVRASRQARHAAKERQGHCGVADEEDSLRAGAERDLRHHRVLELKRRLDEHLAPAALEV
jgi:hypothetical protein